MCTVQIESHSFVCQTEDKVFLLEKTNLNSWKPVKPISPPAKPLDKEVINKKSFPKTAQKDLNFYLMTWRWLFLNVQSGWLVWFSG